MYLIIESGGQIEVCRPLAPNELLDCAHHAQRYGQTMGYDVDTDHPQPTGLGADVDVTIQPYKRHTGRVWNSKGYYFKDES